MSESAFDFPSSDKPSLDARSPQDQAPQDEPPQFGAVDIVEAFTAMRHEWRGQSKESRQLVEQVQAAVQKLEELETKRLSQAEAATSDQNQDSKQLVKLIADTDHQLTRAVEALGQAEKNRQARADADHQAMMQYFNGMNALARWLVRPLLTFCSEHRARSMATQDSSLEGLSLVLARLRHAMQEQGLERIDVLGQPFDGTTMNAIGTVESPDYPPGHVAEQLAPCYRWKNTILRFADVRVAGAPVQTME